MKLTYHFVLVVFCVSVTSTSVYSNLKENLLSYLKVIHKATPRRPQHSRQVEFAQSGFDRPNQNKKNPTLQFINVPPQVEVANEETQHAVDTDAEKLEDKIVVEGTQFLPKGAIGIETYFPKDESEKVTKIVDHWATSHTRHADYLNLNKLVQKPLREYIPQSVISNDPRDAEAAKFKSNILRTAKRHEDELNTNRDIPKIEEGPKIDTQFFHMDPVLNNLRSHSYRRKGNKQKEEKGSSEKSSSREFKDWKKEFEELWLQKKYEALNQTRPKGDQVNMAAARPWGVLCGDPEEHDMPWGSCMLAMECEPEYRIYRGDHFCGRTQFVCCSVQVTSYDLYQGFDVSFEDKSLSTDTEEKKAGKGKKRDKAKEKKKRKEAREKAKEKIKKTIKKVIKEIRKILNKQFRNGTKERKKRTLQLKKFIKQLKKQFKKDRKAVAALHQKDMIHIDNALLAKLNQIKNLNQNFMKNATFREIVLNGTITRQGARMLLQAYPELEAFLEARKNAPPKGVVRRSGGGAVNPLEYDIEYGYMYYD